MPTAEPINAAVAVKNTSRVSLEMMYAQAKYVYPGGGKVKIVPYSIAMHHFGFELGQRGLLVRNTADEYEDGDETPYHAARASYLPWGWMNDQNPVDPRTKSDGSLLDPTPKKDRFEAIRDAWENHITAKVVNMPREMTEAQFEALPT